MKKIQSGDRVFIKPEWQDPGDEKLEWRALEDEDGGRVRIAPVDIGLPITPTQVVETAMLDTTTCTHDPKNRKFYDGALGYEALVCRECGAYCDHNGEYPPNDWSLAFVGLPKRSTPKTTNQNQP